MEVVGDGRCMVAERNQKEIVAYDVGRREMIKHPARESAQLTEQSAVGRGDCEVLHLRHSIECVRGEHPPLVDGREGRFVVAIAVAAERSVERAEVRAL